MTGIVDYGMGNLLSVFSAFEMLGAEVEIITDPAGLEEVERIVVPGVGAFPDCIENLNSTGFATALHHHVLEGRKPTFGICLGMQVMATTGREGGDQQGLGWFEGTVTRLVPGDTSLKIPHVGWNNIEYDKAHPVFAGLPESPEFYFVHSYHMEVVDATQLVATCDYGMQVTAAVTRDNIFATQFHPEKSQDYGLKILENFLAWTPA